jgi:hypothetical protein
MDLTHIAASMREEQKALADAVEALVERSTTRRNEFKRQFLEELCLSTKTDIADGEFAAVLDLLNSMTGTMAELLSHAGLDSAQVAAWLAKTSIPAASFRIPILQLAVQVVFDAYTRASAEEVMCRLSQTRGVGQETSKRRLPLDKKFSDLGLGLHGRVNNGIFNQGMVTLGEVLAQEEKGWSRIPNFGPKSLKELNDALTERFGVTVGCLSGTERDRYNAMVAARRASAKT